MSMRSMSLIASVPIRLLLLGWCWSANGQQATQPVAGSEAGQRAEILDSECWRRAMFELNQWYRTQKIYTPEEVAELRAEFAERVDKMSIKELKDVISDMDAKFRILETPQVQEVRTWFGQYLSVLAERKREDVLRDIPNFATMTPGQLNQEIMKIQRKKQQKRSSSAAFERGRKAQVQTIREDNLAAQAARQQRAAAGGYRSPYRPAAGQCGATANSMTHNSDGGNHSPWIRTATFGGPLGS